MDSDPTFLMPPPVAALRRRAASRDPKYSATYSRAARAAA